MVHRSTDPQGEGKAYAALCGSLDALGLGYIDLYLIHWPGAGGLKSEDPENARLRHESYRDLQRAVSEGVCVLVSQSINQSNQINQRNIIYPPTDSPFFACSLAGKVRGLGVSNFDERHLEALLADPTVTHPPQVNQVSQRKKQHQFRIPFWFNDYV